MVVQSAVTIAEQIGGGALSSHHSKTIVGGAFGTVTERKSWGYARRLSQPNKLVVLLYLCPKSQESDGGRTPCWGRADPEQRNYHSIWHTHILCESKQSTSGARWSMHTTCTCKQCMQL